jgi:hypothetical protein
MSKMASHEPFGHQQHKLWSKKGPGVKLAVWLPTTKSRESTRFQCVQVKCDTPLKSSQRDYNFALDLVPIRVQGKELWASKVPRVQTGTVSGLHFGSPGKKSHLDASAAESYREYYMGEGGGFPRVRAVMSQVSPSCPCLIPTLKRCKMSYNQLVGWIWMQDR